jgi:NAD(P)-dependent dehydrogenase (short-subunit alcohol dehydrogenase family)
MRTVVVGASSGLGRCIAVGLAKRGATVAMMARRQDRLDSAAAEAGAGALAIACDVTDEASCHAAVERAARELGGIDAVVYAPAVGTLQRIEDVDGKTWQQTLATNVVGASLVTAAALPHLRESHGVAAYLSSVTGSQTPPWPGLGAYVVSKAALEKLIDVWRTEHPSLGFTRIIVGDCVGGEGPGLTEFANNWDPQLAAEVGAVWAARGLLAGSFIDVDDLVGVVDSVLRVGGSATLPTVVITPRPAK